MKKKIIAIVLALALVAAIAVGLVACNKNDNSAPQEVEMPAYNVVEPDYSDLQFPADFKVGLITLHDKNSTYDANFINALEEVKKDFNLADNQVIIRSGIEEKEECYNTAMQQVRKLIHQNLATMQTHSHPSTKADTLQVLQQVSSSKQWARLMLRRSVISVLTLMQKLSPVTPLSSSVYVLSFQARQWKLHSQVLGMMKQWKTMQQNP